MSINHDYTDVISTIDGLSTLPVRNDAGSAVMDVDLPAGLYQLSVIVDAREFDWNELYVHMPEPHNRNKRTGPWDFSPVEQNKPLVPAYRVYMDDRSVGMWFFQRLTMADIRRKRFRGRVAFEVKTSGCHTLRLKPFRPMAIRWQAAQLEVDPEESFEPLPDLKSAEGNVPAAKWRDANFWLDLKDKLTTTHAMYNEPLERMFAWLYGPGRQEEIPMDARWTGDNAYDIPLFVASQFLAGRNDGIDLALKCIDEYIGMPTWGNRNPDGYSHNGDMTAMAPLRNLAAGYHIIGDAMGDERRARLVEKLRLQGDVFFEQMLLNRDYWGGSMLQDHGWKSMFGFANAALHMHGIVPEANRWLSVLLPRIRRMLDMSVDEGPVPASSHRMPFLWMDEIALCRDVLLSLCDEDLLDHAPFRNTAKALAATAPLDRSEDMTSAGTVAIFNQIASKYRDPHAAWTAQQHLLIETPRFITSTHRRAYFHGILDGLLAYDPSVKSEPIERLPRLLSYWPDLGFAHYRDDASGMTWSVQCGPPDGYSMWPKTVCPCDCLDGAPATGHFTINLGGAATIGSTENSYRLRTNAGNTLLVDGRGQRDDVGYPMSVPRQPYHGAHIACARWDDQAQRGTVTLDLTPAYDEALGIAQYQRQFRFEAGRRMIVRDQIVLDEPRTLSWLFHCREDRGPTPDGKLAMLIGGDMKLRIEPVGPSLDLTATIAPTDIVYTYLSASGFMGYRHVRYDTKQPVGRAIVDFVMTW
jgi:hypothetical protein